VERGVVGVARLDRPKEVADAEKTVLALSWEREINSPEFWKQMLDPNFISDDELWALRYKLRRELIEFTRRRLLIQGERLSRGDFIAFDHLLNPDALTIGFGRRFRRETKAFQWACLRQ
jgi:starch phosphorylase